ncbi:hypothetical protein RND81_12G074400 [Saponaria officinalis]|uniref:Glycosyl hydrolase family 13 catalytic domain-containing protein n=1 Tax=Saponaria officinalis TaxID=3572 RepID=A0AAW1H7Q1_SAPOF
MAMFSTPFVIGLSQTSNSSADSYSRFAYSCDLFGRRTFKYERKTVRQREHVLVTADHSVKCSARELIVRAHTLSNPSIYRDEQKLSKYCFWTENVGQVTVAVGKKNVRYPVQIEFFPVSSNDNQTKLILSWGIYRSDSTSFIPLEFQSSSNGQNAISEISVLRNSFGSYVVEMEFESYLAPFYLSFLLKYAEKDNSEIKSHRNTNFCVPVGFTSGNPAPLGVSFMSDGRINFALFSRNAERVFLCLFDDNASEKPALEIELDPYVNRTGDIWHASIDSAGPFLSYGYRCKKDAFDGTTSRVLLDPYAKLLRKKVPGLPDLGELCAAPAFDWSRDVHPKLPLEKLTVYRLNVKKFTSDKSSKLSSNISGTFSGVTEKIDHLKSLGFNAILLEPIFAFTENLGPYFPFHFFSPMQAYGPFDDSASAINSMKNMVKKMHDSGIEVFLEVVFSHTADDNAIRDVDSSYFYTEGDPDDLGGRNALNCNYPIVQQMIVESLRYWVSEFRIDGFCFVNASYLLRGFHGESLSRPPLIETITYDPVLSKTKMIADCWDPYDLVSKETRFPHWKKWAEINSKFSVDVRNFLRGKGLISDLATRLCGSGDIFSTGRAPSFSFNFITRNSGLPLVDLVSFSGSDLANDLSWNCGEEGATSNKVVLETRLKQIRNFLFILFISLGIPVLNMGDECGLSAGGSPAYTDKKPLNWSAVTTPFGIQITRFISYMISLRERRSDLLQKREFLKEEHIGWFHSDLSAPKWDDPSTKFLAMKLTPETKGIEPSLDSSSVEGKFYVAFNAGQESETIILPALAEEMAWVRLVDTGLPYPGFFSDEGVVIPAQVTEPITYEMKPHSCVLLEAKIQQHESL